MINELYGNTATRLRSVVLSRVLFVALIWAAGSGIPATTWCDPRTLILDQQTLNTRQQQDLLREQRAYQQRLQNTTPGDQAQLKQRFRQQRFHQQQLQRRQLQNKQILQQQGRIQSGINRSNQNAVQSLRSRRAQESQRLEFKLQRRIWPYR